MTVRIGVPELLVVLLIVLIVLGPTQIPKLAKILGKGVKGFREGLDMAEDETSERDAEKDGTDGG